MDTNSYDQITVSEVILGDKKKWLYEGILVDASVYENRVIDVILPNNVELEIIEAEPSLKNATVTGSFKKAVLQGQIHVNVPQYLSVGDKIVVKTECASFVRKAKNN